MDGWKPIERSGVSGAANSYPSSSRTRKRLRVERGTGAWAHGTVDVTSVMDACMQRKERESRRARRNERPSQQYTSHYSLSNVTHTAQARRPCRELSSAIKTQVDTIVHTSSDGFREEAN
jgi:hypothetical protein